MEEIDESMLHFSTGTTMIPYLNSVFNSDLNSDLSSDFNPDKVSGKKTLLSIVALLAVLLLAGCNNGNVTGSDDDDDDNGGNEIQAIEDAATIDFSAENQMIRGFGAATVFRLNLPLTDNDMDLLFGDGPGQVGLNILRIRVISDVNPGSRAIELDNAQRAIARGAIVIATPWSAPARMKTNNSLVGGSVKPESYGDYATYLNDFAEYMADNDAELYAVSVQNEPDIEVSYESNDWLPSEMLTFVRDHGDKITATRLIAPESFQFRKNMSDPILEDPVARANVDIIGGHIYGGGLEPYPLAQQHNKELWMTEHLELETGWQAALATGQEIHDSMTIAHFNAYIWWYARRFYGPISSVTPSSPEDQPEEVAGDARVTQRGYVMSHYARFVRPEFVNVDVTDNPASDNLFISAYTCDWDVIVVINRGFAPMEITYTLENGMSTEFTPYQSTANSNVVEGTPVSVTGNSFTHTVPPFSITTYRGN